MRHLLALSLTVTLTAASVGAAHAGKAPAVPCDDEVICFSLDPDAFRWDDELVADRSWLERTIGAATEIRVRTDLDGTDVAISGAYGSVAFAYRDAALVASHQTRSLRADVALWELERRAAEMGVPPLDRELPALRHHVTREDFVIRATATVGAIAGFIAGAAGGATVGTMVAPPAIPHLTVSGAAAGARLGWGAGALIAEAWLEQLCEEQGGVWRDRDCHEGLPGPAGSYPGGSAGGGTSAGDGAGSRPSTGGESGHSDGGGGGAPVVDLGDDEVVPDEPRDPNETEDDDPEGDDDDSTEGDDDDDDDKE